MHLDPLGDRISRIELIDSMGGDLSVANDARASFGKVHDELTDKDIKLINYLIAHDHFSPLRGVCFKFKVKAPLYTCRQWFKHTIASNHNDDQQSWNEKSLRYVAIADENEFYIPSVFRMQSKSNRQATTGSLPHELNDEARSLYENMCQQSFENYQRLLDMGVGREQARGILVPAVYTSWVWTVSLQAVLHFIDLRKGEGAQSEIVLYAEAIEKLIEPIVFETIKAWRQNAAKKTNK